jgi:hypothetical protein
MGLFDKAKGFFGGHGVTVELTKLERQDPAAARFPITDSVFKGNYTVKADKESVVLKHVHRAILRIDRPDGGYDEHFLSENTHDHRTDIIGADIKWPYTLAAGESKSDGFILMDIDIPAYLRKAGFHSPNQAVGNPNVKLMIEVIADVKGSPFDPKATATVVLTGDSEVQGVGGSFAVPTGPARPLAYYEDGWYECAVLESGPQGHHIQWDDGTDSWVATDELLPTGETIPHASQLSSGQRVVARYEVGFYECSVASVDPGDMVNPAKALINWDDGAESWVSIKDVRVL